MSKASAEVLATRHTPQFAYLSVEETALNSLSFVDANDTEIAQLINGEIEITDWMRSYATLFAASPRLLEALKAMTTLMQQAADEIDTDVRHPLRGYGGKTVRENIHEAKAAIEQAEGRSQ